MTDNNALTVHVAAKKSVTQYEPVEVGASFTFAMPENATLDDMVRQQDAMYQALSAVVEEQVASLVDDMRQMEANRASRSLYGDPEFEGFDTPAEQEADNTDIYRTPPPPDDLDEYFGPRQNAPQAAQEARSDVSSDNTPQRLQYAPKAAEREPGQWWVTDVEQYALSGNKLDLYRTSSKYPDASIYEGSPSWPGAWIDKMNSDGQRHDFAKPVRVRQEISSKQNSKGFYYVDVTSLEVVSD